MLDNFLSEVGIKSELELNEIEVSILDSFSLQITSPRLLSAQVISRLLYALFHKLNYLFNYLDYQIKVREITSNVSKNVLQEYLVLIFSTPFL